MEKDKEKILNFIKNKEYKQAIDLFYQNIKMKLRERLKREKDIDLEEPFIKILDASIREFDEDYELLTYIRNLYLLSEKNDEEKLFELLEIYKIIY